MYVQNVFEPILLYKFNIVFMCGSIYIRMKSNVTTDKLSIILSHRKLKTEPYQKNDLRLHIELHFIHFHSYTLVIIRTTKQIDWCIKCAHECL